MLHSLTSMLLLCGAGTLGIAQAGSSSQLHEYELDNGLKLIVKEDHRAPVVVSQVWYKVGSTYEHDGITGVSHLLEHMMFKGTDKLKPGQFSRIISRNGGRENAFTGRDYTAYFQRLEKSRLEVSFKWEADRMRGLKLDPKEVAKEANVVKEERRLRTEDNPQSLTYERFNAAAFQNSPLRTPIVGWMDDLENMETADLQQWYQLWYAPNNATVVVVGDVDPDDVEELAEKYFGPLKAEATHTPKPRREPEQKGVRRITVKAPAQVPYLLMGYKAPNLATAAEEWEAYALDMLAGVLDGGASARLPRELVREQKVAVSVGAGYDLFSRLPGLFLFDGTPTSSHTVADLEKAIREQIKRVQIKPVKPEELTRIRSQVVAGKVYERDSMFYQAMQIGMLETVGYGHERLDDYLERIQSVTPEQIQQVAKKYFQDDLLTVAVLEPQPMESAKRPRSAGSGRHGR